MVFDQRIVEIDEDGYRALVTDCRIIEKDDLGAKVFLSPDDSIIKVFRLKRLISSALLVPYAVRFANNAERLRLLGIRSVEVRAMYRLRSRRQHLVSYPRLPGETLRAAVAADSSSPPLLATLARYLARLHEKGVLFRSIHFANIIVEAPEAFALIDISDMRFKARPLPTWERLRNFRHLLRYGEDREALAHYGEERFVSEYLQSARLKPEAGRSLSRRILKAFEERA